jgi:low affinity Fe/Cu permease
MTNVKSVFNKLSKSSARMVGKPSVFVLALSIVLLWAVTGSYFDYSDTWQLIINTGTSIVTFLMVFIIQNTQNRDTEAMQIKLDELIRAIDGAHNALLDLEELDQNNLDRFRGAYQELARNAREDLKNGIIDTGSPHLK